jgi:hypothetical protein
MTYIHTYNYQQAGHFTVVFLHLLFLTLILLTWRIWWAPNNASRWHMGFNSAFKGLKHAAVQHTTFLWHSNNTTGYLIKL